MAEIHFVDSQAFLGEDKEQGEKHLYEDKITEILSVPSDFLTDVSEIILGISESVSEDMSASFFYVDDVLYARIYDGEKYLFPLPFMLSENADAEGACINLAEYSVREMIPLIITDVPRDEIDFLGSVFPHIDAFCYEDDEDSFFVKVNNECDMLTEIPTVNHSGITLDEIRASDKDLYASLCRDRLLNEYWGYDVDIDNPEGNADFYLDVARREFDDGIAITLAIRESEEFLGEATVYGFDCRGGASIAVRVLPAAHSKGIGSRAMGALIELSKNIGLEKLYVEILNENEKSINMTAKHMELVKRTDCKTYFALSLK